jgi:hypothetical protein
MRLAPIPARRARQFAMSEAPASSALRLSPRRSTGGEAKLIDLGVRKSQLRLR